MPKEIKEKIETEIEEKLESIVRHLIILGYDMGREQIKTPYKYTCDTDKGEKYWKQLLELFAKEKQKVYNEGFDKAINLITFAVNKARPNPKIKEI